MTLVNYEDIDNFSGVSFIILLLLIHKFVGPWSLTNKIIGASLILR